MIGLTVSFCLLGKANRTHRLPEVERLIELLSAARTRRGFSQRALSKELGFHLMTIGKIERGERALQVGELIEICRILGEDPAQLLRTSMGR